MTAPARRSDFSARAIVLSLVRVARERYGHASWGGPARAGELLEEMSVISALHTARAMVRALEQVVAEEAPGAAVPANVGSSDVGTANCQVAPGAPSTTNEK